MEPTIIFCTTCKNRAQHIKLTLPINLANNKLTNTKFVLIDYSSADDLAEYIKEHHTKDLNSGKLLFYQYRGDHAFRMAHAKNVAHRVAILEGADILVNLDADNYTGPDFDKYVQDKFKEEDIFLRALMIKGVLPRGISGRIVVTKEAFLNVGGYDEKYEKHSPDDKDFTARLKRVGYTAYDVDNIYLDAVRHTDKMRFKEYPDAINSGEEEFYINQHNRVVNYGNFGCATLWKNFSETPIELSPVPTRIFGIGMHKTGTTSLHTALDMLGFKSGHWKNAHWAKSIWNQMTNEKRSATLEKYYALCDLPIPLLYKELDSAYPNSKFILTIRDESSWLESVRKHWDAKYNPYRNQWKKDPFTNIVHRLTYGQTEFDEKVMIEKFRKHNAEVKEYFADRPNNILIIDLAKDDNWEKLCKFLNCQHPNKEFPVSNKCKVV